MKSEPATRVSKANQTSPVKTNYRFRNRRKMKLKMIREPKQASRQRRNIKLLSDSQKTQKTKHLNNLIKKKNYQNRRARGLLSKATNLRFKTPCPTQRRIRPQKRGASLRAPVCLLQINRPHASQTNIRMNSMNRARWSTLISRWKQRNKLTHNPSHFSKNKVRGQHKSTHKRQVTLGNSIKMTPSSSQKTNYYQKKPLKRILMIKNSRQRISQQIQKTVTSQLLTFKPWPRRIRVWPRSRQKTSKRALSKTNLNHGRQNIRKRNWTKSPRWTSSQRSQSTKTRLNQTTQTYQPQM